MTGEHWYRFRLATYVFAFLAAVATPFFVPREPLDFMAAQPPWMLAELIAGAFVLMATFPLMALFVVGIQAINPWSDRVWSMPTLRSNPFNSGNPLTGLHDAVYVVGVGGLGVLVSSLWNGLVCAAVGVLQIFGAAMIFVAVRLCRRVFHHKFSEPR
jgi:hypothetical protein